jgi:putative ABC transport system substrate-binding protein
MDSRGSRLSRRLFVLGASAAGLVAGCGRLPWQGPGQTQPARMPRIGWLTSLLGVESPGFAAFKRGLEELGYNEPHNVTIDTRDAEGRADRLQSAATELAKLPVDVIVAGDSPAVFAAREATDTIPIVMTVLSDPATVPFVGSLARPIGNVTGLSNMSSALSGKRLELLRLAAPASARVAAVGPRVHPDWPGLVVAAQALSLELLELWVDDAGDLERVLGNLGQEQADGLAVLPSPLTNSYSKQVVEAAARNGLPGVYGARSYVAAGGLMSYGPDLLASFRRAAYYVDRILRGAKPADLPIEQPMTFELVVNWKTAQALGITFPNEIMLQVTEVIQ